MALKVVCGDFRYGKIMYLPGDIYIGNSLALYGEYSQAEADLYSQFVRPGHTVVEVGANIGSLTIPLAQMAGEQGRVIAFEPQQFIFQMLAGNIALNNLHNVYTYNKGVGGEPTTMIIPDIIYDKGTNNGCFQMKSCEKGYRVEVVPLDSLGLTKCDFLKLDVEGMELEVFKGAEQLISRTQPIIYMEIDPELIEQEKAWLKEHGYRVYRHVVPLFNKNNYFGSTRNVFLEIGQNFEKTEEKFGNACSWNMVCIPKSKNIEMKDFQEL